MKPTKEFICGLFMTNKQFNYIGFLLWEKGIFHTAT